MKDPYLYEDVPVLINKMNIKDRVRLQIAEADITTIKLLSANRLNNGQAFGLSYLKKLHKHIFGDIYPFAGEVRAVPIVKAEKVLGGDTVRYSPPSEIENTVVKTIRSMNDISWRSLSLEERAMKFTKATASLWQAHPFREGNTRTIMTFAEHYAERNGFPIDSELFKGNAEYLRNSLVKASDGIYSDYQYLNRIIKDSMELGEEAFIIERIKAAGFRPSKRLMDDMKSLNRAFEKLLSVKDLKSYSNNIDSLPKEKAELVNQAVKDFADQEIQAAKIKSLDKGAVLSQEP